MSHFKMLDGNSAAVQAVTDAKVQVISAYPITPQTSIAEKLSENVAFGQLDARYIRVESEHSAMSVAIGAQLAGVRTATATSSVGLALMHEMVNAASGVRVPIVMPVVNRSLAAPWSLWCDHQDAMAERDSGWLQFYSKNVQDVYDLILCAYRISEHEKVLTPSMVCMDGFFLSHSMQKVMVCEPDEAYEFVGKYVPRNLVIDPDNPMIIDDLTPTSDFTEVRYQQKVGFDQAPMIIDQVFAEFEQRFGRKHERIRAYKTEDAEIAFITLGSMGGTAEYFVDQCREKGLRVGAINITCYRPFPADLLKNNTQNIRKLAIIERTAGLGAQFGPLYLDVASALRKQDAVLYDYVAGLAGRDVNLDTFEKALRNVSETNICEEPMWLDVNENAMNIREVPCHD